MFNAFCFKDEDARLQLFLWREEETSEPETYMVLVNNMGIKPAGSIAATALYNSCNEFSTKYPVTSEEIKDSSYVDDLGLTAEDKVSQRKKCKEADEILEHANMKVHKWIVSGDLEDPVEIGQGGELVLTAEEVSVSKVLGITWCLAQDVFRFKIRINLSLIVKKRRMVPDITKEELSGFGIQSITRR